jgi:hypothetical protein
LAFLRKILAFLRVLARCFRVVKPEIVWYFLVWTYWGQESEFQRRTNRIAVGFEVLQKKATKKTKQLGPWTWSGKVSWKRRGRAAKGSTPEKRQLSLKQKHLGLKKRSDLLPKEIGLCWVRLMALVPILAIKWLRCCTLRCCRKLPEVAMFEFLHNYLWDVYRLNIIFVIRNYSMQHCRTASPQLCFVEMFGPIQVSSSVIESLGAAL